MKILIMGDTHASVGAFRMAMPEAVEMGIDTIFQVGDFGYWPRSEGTRFFLEDVSRLAEEGGITVRWLPGNHEDWEIYLTEVENGPKDEYGFTPVDAGGRVLAAPPTHTWEWDGLKFGSVGGAYSIDRANRTLGRSWFKEELPQWHYPQAFDSDIDVMLSHDAPVNLARALGWRSIPIAEPDESEQSNVVIHNCYQMAQPSLAVHGHWHWFGMYPIDYVDDIPDGKVVALAAADQSPLQRSSIILDTETRKAYTVDQYIYEGEPFWQS